MLIPNIKQRRKQLMWNWYELFIFNVANRFTEWANKPKYVYIDYVVHQADNLRFE